MPLPSREEMLKKVRAKAAEQKNTRKDPDEFRVPKITDNKETKEYIFFILPDLQAGDQCRTGVCENGMENYYYENGFHWFDNQKYECPRIHDHDSCPMCDMGFELMKDSDDKDYKQKISSKYLARGHYAVNIYFLNAQKNPEELRGKVMWYNAPRTIFEKWDQCINNDDPGDDVDPKACGIFYHPQEGCYAFKLIAKKKGDWNTYEESLFLAKTFAPLAVKDGAPDDERIAEILAQRHWLPSKFASRNVEKLQALVNKISAAEQGADDEENINEEAPAATAKPAAKPAGLKAPPTTAKPAPAPKAEVAEEVGETAETAETSEVEDEVVEDAPPAKPAPAPAAKPKPAAPAAAAKPAPAATKPAPAAAKPTPAASPAASAAGDDEELAELLGAIKGTPGKKT
jgi:hypothetical protein